MKKVIGIDLGSRTVKIVHLLNKKIVHKEIFDTGHNPLKQIKESLRSLNGAPIMATGYGRYLICENFPEARRVTEIKACARGTRFHFPHCRTILDVGGQDCKVINLDEDGRLDEFQMNDRCAAGTGKFLEIMAQTFSLQISDFAGLALSADKSISINSMCIVFAESEVISLITAGKPKQQIALGLHESVSNRLYSMLTRMPAHDDIIFVGGGARNDCLHGLLEKQLAKKILRPDGPQIVTALGAALLAGEEISRNNWCRL